MPYVIEALAGKPFQPSNGTEGMVFDSMFCDQCYCDEKYRSTLDPDDGCPILRDAFIYDPSDEGYPKEWRHDAAGRPVCTAYCSSDGQPGSTDQERQALELVGQDRLF